MAKKHKVFFGGITPNDITISGFRRTFAEANAAATGLNLTSVDTSKNRNEVHTRPAQKMSGSTVAARLTKMTPTVKRGAGSRMPVRGFAHI